MKNEAEKIYIRDYNYDLPQEKIADYPLAERDQSKLLICKNGSISDEHFYNLQGHLPAGSTLVLNNTRVIEARMLFKKPTGGVIEIFCLEPYGQAMETSLQANAKVQWLCLIGGASKWKPGQILRKTVTVAGENAVLSASYVKKEGDSFVIAFSWEPQHFSFAEIIHAAGNIPLPPYIKREVTSEDSERYQTVFAKEEGSVAAPTAALHFTNEVFKNLASKNIKPTYVTLHVGAGTFKPVKTETVAEHEMHREPFTVSLHTLKKLLHSENVIAVGTTSLRTLETIHWLGVKLIKGIIKDEWTLHQWEAYELSEDSISARESLSALIQWLEVHQQSELHCSTGLIIVPGYEFNVPQALITNFHQPQSTLLLLVSAFIGEDWRKVYHHALENNYRFLSYGDSSLLWKGGDVNT